jgi:SAM-dependent methyltransferase
MKYIKKLNNCIACDSNKLHVILNLGNQPLANSFLKNKNKNELKFPLKLCKCKNCHHLQLSHAVDPDKLFKNYLYVSGTTTTQLQYFEWFAKQTFKKLKFIPQNILDIGCNDGSQLDVYKKYGIKTYGIDPAKNLYKLSSKNHNVVCDYFNSYKYPKDTKFDLIICQNAFAHNFDQKQFLEKAKTLLANNGKIYITISQAKMIENNEFDTIYHEHLSFYCVNSMNILCKRVGLNLNNVLVHPIHGTTYIFEISKNIFKNDNLNKFLLKEKKAKLNLESTYIKYAGKCKQISKNFVNKIKELKKKQYVLIGYGAPAKANTFLNYCKIDLDFVIDDNSLKQNLYTPGRKIKIYNSSKLKDIKLNNQNVCFVPLAWNFFEEIYKKIKLIRNKKTDLYLKYFPHIKEIKP